MHQRGDGDALLLGGIRRGGRRVGLDGTGASLVHVRRDRAEHPPEGHEHPAEDECERDVEGDREPVVARERPLDEPDDAEQDRDERGPHDLEEEREGEHAGDGRNVDEVPDPRLVVGVGRPARGGDRPEDERERVHQREDPREQAHAAAGQARDQHRRERHERHHHERDMPARALLARTQRGEECLRAEGHASEAYDDGDDPLDAQARERPETRRRLPRLRNVTPRIVEDRAGALRLRHHRHLRGRSARRGSRPPWRGGAGRPW